jgi:hypothetical protein
VRGGGRPGDRDRIADGEIDETWRNADDLGRLLQLEARVEPAAAD